MILILGDISTAADRFVHDHVNRSVFMIANLDFVGVLIDIPSNYFVIGLLTLSDDIEGITDFDAHVFVLWGVVDAVFADELLIAFVIFLIKANRPGGQWHAEFVLL